MKHPERIEDYLEHIAGAIDRAVSYVEPAIGRRSLSENPASSGRGYSQY
jgi:hypothetical protein